MVVSLLLRGTKFIPLRDAWPVSQFRLAQKLTNLQLFLSCGAINLLESGGTFGDVQLLFSSFII